MERPGKSVYREAVCGSCGEEVENGSLFCKSCGLPVAVKGKSREEAPGECKGESASGLSGLEAEAVAGEAVFSPEAQKVKEDAPAQGLSSRKKRLLLFALIFVALAAAGAGAWLFLHLKGSERRKAAEFLRQGDQTYEWSKIEGEKALDQINNLLFSLLQGKFKTSAEFRASADGARKRLQDIRRDIKKATWYYEKILGLKRAEHYKNYARERILQLDKVSGSIKATEKLIRRITDILASAEAGARINKKQIEDEIARIYRDVKALSSQADVHKKRAEEIKTSKNL